MDRSRDIRIDILRGVAIATVLIGHFSFPYERLYGPLHMVVPTPTRYGYSSAASLFVAISGYMVGMVYLGRPHWRRLILKRAARLYLVNLAMLALSLPIVPFFTGNELRYFGFAAWRDAPGAALGDFLLLRTAPMMLDILQLYVIFMLATPAAMWIARRSPRLLIASSVGLWAGLQLLAIAAPAAAAAVTPLRWFNPLAWQMVFFLPMLAGERRLHAQAFDWLRRHPRMLPALMAGTFASAVAFKFQLHRYDPLHDTLGSARLHGAIWTAHALLVLATYAAMIVAVPVPERWWPLRIVAMLGRNTLAVYAASIPAAFLLVVLMSRINPGDAGYLGGVAGLAGLGILVACLADGRMRRPAAGRRPATGRPDTGGRMRASGLSGTLS